MTYRYATSTDRMFLRFESHADAVDVGRDEDGRVGLAVAVSEETLEDLFPHDPLVPERDAELAIGAATTNRALQPPRKYQWRLVFCVSVNYITGEQRSMLSS